MADYVGYVLCEIRERLGEKAEIAAKTVLNYKRRALRGDFDKRKNISAAQKVLVDQYTDEDIINAAYAFLADGVASGDTLLTRIVRPAEAEVMGRAESLDDCDDEREALANKLAAPEPEDVYAADNGPTFVCDGAEEREAIVNFISQHKNISARAAKMALLNVVSLSAEITRRALLRRFGKQFKSAIAKFDNLAYNSKISLDISTYALQRLLENSRIPASIREQIETFADTPGVGLDFVEQNRRCAIAMLAPLCWSARALYELSRP